MRLLGILALLIGASFGQSSTLTGTFSISGTASYSQAGGTPVTTCPSGYTFSRQVLLLPAVGSDLTDFPYAVHGQYASFATAANSGEVQNTASGFPADFVVRDGSGNTLSYEMWIYDASHGKFDLKFKQPTLHSAGGDYVYFCANNSSVTTSQQDVAGTYSNHQKAMVHFEENAGNTTVTDAIGNFTSMTSSVNTSSLTSDGAKGKAFFFGQSNSSSSVVMANSAALVTATGARTTCALVSSTRTIRQAFFGQGGSGTGNGFVYESGVTSPGLAYFVGYAQDISGSISAADGPFRYLCLTYNGSTVKMSVDGVSAGSGSVSLSTPSSSFYIGRQPWLDPGSNDQFSVSKIDELTYSDIDRSTDWIATAAKTETPYASTAIIVEPSYTQPTVLQYASCQTASVATCTLPFSATSGNVVVVAAAVTDGTCTSVSDNLSSTYTLKTSSTYTGTIHSYQSCIYTTTLGSSGTLTVAGFSGANASFAVMEVTQATTSGIVTASDNTHAPPSTLSNTSPGANSLMVCAVRRDPSDPATTVTPASFTVFTGPQHGMGNDHESQLSVMYGNVGTGTQSCTPNVGAGGTMVMIP